MAPPLTLPPLPPLPPLLSLSDEALLDRLQRSAFEYLRTYADPKTGLVADTSRPGAPASIAVVGFALSCYPVAVERGWLDRASAAALTLTALRFFAASEQSEAPGATGYHGFYYHFLDMPTGRRVWQCEVSVVDTALLIAGVLTAATYFDGDGAEREIRALADALYRRVDWAWAQNGGETVTQGWKPECGFLRDGWEGYNEATIVYLLGIGSPTFALPPTSFAAWTATYQWENLLDIDVLYAGPLFTHLFSHAWIDYRGIRDGFMREKRSDYFINTQQAIAVQREYCARNPEDYVAYDRDLWGISAGDGPSHAQMGRQHHDLRVFGYMARGAPLGPDDGTLAPWAMPASLPFAAADALRGTRQLLARYPQVCPEDRFVSGFNPTYADGDHCWLSEGWYGLDQGLLVMMLENHRSGLNWRLMRECRYLRDGLRRAGFEGAWLERYP
jgi:hypothetical protein